jgi:hypothetical protein
MPPAASKKGPHGRAHNSPTARKQPSKKRSTTTPQQKPAKKSKKPQSDDTHVTKPAPKKRAKAKANPKDPLSGPVETDKGAISDSPTSDETRPTTTESFIHSQQTVQRLNAWKYQASRLPSSTSPVLQNGTLSTYNTKAVQQANGASSNDRISILSPVISYDVVRASQGHGHTVYDSSTLTSSTHHLRSNVRTIPQSTTSHFRPPLSTRHALDTILEKSPPSSSEVARVPLHSSKPLVTVSTQPRSTPATNFNSDPVEDDLFAELDDEDLLDLDAPSDSASLEQDKPLRTSFQSPQFTHNSSSSRSHHAALEIPIVIDSDDEWTVLEDEDETALLELTPDVAQRPVNPSSKAISSIANTSRQKASVHPNIDVQQGQKSILCPSTTSAANLTPAEATEDYLSSILHPPIIRPPFPSPIRDRSTLLGVSSTLVLRTCFRIGECLNVGCTATRSSQTQSSESILIELYAKVVSSYRDVNGVTQHFVLADLFHDLRGPFVQAVCETWKGSDLWEYDCGRFLGDGGCGRSEKKICRAVGRMKRDVKLKEKGWRFVILNIWEATWEDVENVRGIVCG